MIYMIYIYIYIYMYMYMYIYNQLREACITCIMDFFVTDWGSYCKLGHLYITSYNFSYSYTHQSE